MTRRFLNANLAVAGDGSCPTAEIANSNLVSRKHTESLLVDFEFFEQWDEWSICLPSGHTHAPEVKAKSWRHVFVILVYVILTVFCFSFCAIARRENSIWSVTGRTESLSMAFSTKRRYQMASRSSSKKGTFHLACKELEVSLLPKDWLHFTMPRAKIQQVLFLKPFLLLQG